MGEIVPESSFLGMCRLAPTAQRFCVCGWAQLLLPLLLHFRLLHTMVDFCLYVPLSTVKCTSVQFS